LTVKSVKGDEIVENTQLADDLQKAIIDLNIGFNINKAGFNSIRQVNGRNVNYNAYLRDSGVLTSNLKNTDVVDINSTVKAIDQNGNILEKKITQQLTVQQNEKEPLGGYQGSMGNTTSESGEKTLTPKQENANRVYYQLNVNQKNVVERPTKKSDTYKIKEADGQIHEYERVTTFIGENWVGETAKGSSAALSAGSMVDTIMRNFFKGEKIERPKDMAENVFQQLKDILENIQQQINERGEKFYTNNIVLYAQLPGGKRIAGEVDILAVDKDGNFKIYDVKTRRSPFLDMTDKSGKKIKGTYDDILTSREGYQIRSDREHHTKQLSLYKDLFEAQYNTPITQLAILPLVVKKLNNGQIFNITAQKGIVLKYKKDERLKGLKENKENNDFKAPQNVEENVWRSLIDTLKKTKLASRVFEFSDPVKLQKKLESLLGKDKAIQLMKTPQGEIYGFVDSKNNVYLDQNKMNANSPIHEFAHLWINFIKNDYKELYERGKELVSGLADIISKEEAYKNLPRERLLDEAMARIIGDKGENLIQQLVDKDKDKTLLQKIRDWVKEI